MSLINYLPKVERLNEAVSNANFEKALSLIKNYFTKYGIWTHKSVTSLQVDGTTYYGIFTYNCNTMNGAYFLFEQTNNTIISGIAFTSNASEVLYHMMEGGSMKFNISVNCNGISLGSVVPFAKDVILGKEKMDKRSVDAFFRTRVMWESIDEEVVNLLTEDELDDMKKQRDRLSHQISAMKKKGGDTSDLEAQRAVLASQIKIKTNATVKINDAWKNEIVAQEEELEERATPEERFQDMEHYINMVINGVQPSLIICGAPGVGKTFRVMRKVKASGLNYMVIKGKETPLKFFTDLFMYRHEDDLIVIDDVPSIFTDETAVELYKAATDSSDERLITYGTSKPPVLTTEEYESLPPEDQELIKIDDTKNRPVYMYPATFETKCRIINISNLSSGQIDTAIRNRAIMCDLDFTPAELFSLVESIMPAIMPDKYTPALKMEALERLKKYHESGKPMSISIRSFCMICGIIGDVEDERQRERMISEQMQQMAKRGGKKH